MKTRIRTALLLSLLGWASVPAACYSGSLVGAECADGFTECEGQCVDLESDSFNCGACGVVCPAGRACYQGLFCEVFDRGAGGSGTGGTLGEGGAAR